MPLGLLVVGLLHAAPALNPHLEQARIQADDFDYAGALRTLELALGKPGNDRETTLGILELQGIVWGNLNKGPKARAAFLILLMLDPDRKLSGDHPPRVRTPFYEAKELVARWGALSVTRAPISKEADQIVGVGVGVTHDSQKLVRAVRIHTRVGEQERVTDAVPDARGAARVATVATEVRWWVEVLGEKEAVLMELGSQAQPLIDSALVPPEPPPVPLVQAEPVDLSQPRPSSRSWLRPTGIALGAGAVVAGGIGAYFAVSSSSARALISSPTRDATGAITSLTQVQAAQADARARDSALIANTLFGVAGGLFGVGVVLFIAGGGEDVTVTPTGSGVSVSGRF